MPDHPFRTAEPTPAERPEGEAHEYRVNLLTVIQMFADGVLPTGMQGVSTAIDSLERAISSAAVAPAHAAAKETIGRMTARLTELERALEEAREALRFIADEPEHPRALEHNHVGGSSAWSAVECCRNEARRALVSTESRLAPHLEKNSSQEDGR